MPPCKQALPIVTFERRLLHPRHWGNWITVGLLYAGSRLPWSAMSVLAKAMGFVLYALAPFRRQVAAINIALCFPELPAPQQGTLVRDIFVSHAMGLLETAFAWWGSDARLQGRVEASGF